MSPGAAGLTNRIELDQRDRGSASVKGVLGVARNVAQRPRRRLLHGGVELLEAGDQGLPPLAPRTRGAASRADSGARASRWRLRASYAHVWAHQTVPRAAV